MIPIPKRPSVLETGRLKLQPLTEAELADIFPLMDEAEVMASWEVAEVDDPDVVAAIVRAQVDDMAAGRSLSWSIRTLDDGQFVGCCDLTEIDRRHKRAEVGFMLGHGAWEHGYAEEAMQAAVGYAAASGLRRLTARTHLGARRSETLLETLGFREEGLLRRPRLRGGERRDGRLFGLTL